MRDETSSVKMQLTEDKKVAFALATSIKDIFEPVWQPVTKANASWTPHRRSRNERSLGVGDKRPNNNTHGSRRVIFYHITAFLDVNESDPEFIRFQSSSEKKGV